MKYNLSDIMRKAWSLFRKLGISFGECLHRAWAAAKAEPVNAERIAKAKAAAGIVLLLGHLVVGVYCLYRARTGGYYWFYF